MEQIEKKIEAITFLMELNFLMGENNSSEKTNRIKEQFSLNNFIGVFSTYSQDELKVQLDRFEAKLQSKKISKR
jgi:hypothetical protein